MDFGLNFFPVFTPDHKSASQFYREAIALSQIAEEYGFEHVQTVEHYGTPYGGYSPDPVTLLSAIAARTKTIRVATGAVIPAFSHPLQLASKLAMLDNISEGRLDVGFGRAWLPQEFEWLGVSIDESRRRFSEGIEACRRLWTEENVVFEGEFHSFGPVTLSPRPYQQSGPPVFVASASSPESCAAAGQAGYHLQIVPTIVSPETVVEMLTAYRKGWADAGHRAGAARIQLKYNCYLSDDRDEALRRGEEMENNHVVLMSQAAEGWLRKSSDQYKGYDKLVDKAREYDFGKALSDGRILAGNTDDVVRQLDATREEYGDDLCVSIQVNSGYTDFRESERTLRLFAEQVAPRFRPAAR
ncbi:LLM class flavin-dependent oxidoreductase [Streptomyces sp. SP2-10]|uniref:LLM class flavin-dependent oxidoreductase n=1 Tax=Streptomyces sp. SP2-10 TaxID=2873385 RepID=UPI001CA6C785|nr:LLM class flavin-dependent oxidoreductase [Streptomyces sp. SP2-10]MBY8845356.1 LLM class flavin-dependent oxidoreductase [Streptomyces sp. SP2-10]